MSGTSESTTNAPVTSRQSRPARWRRGIAIVICAAVLCWCGSVLHQRLTDEWYLAYSISGFVPYGYHDNAFSPDCSLVAIVHSNESKVVDLTNGDVVSTLDGYMGQGLADFSSDGKIVSDFPGDVSVEQKAYLWNSLDGQLLGSIEAPNHSQWGFGPIGPP